LLSVSDAVLEEKGRVEQDIRQILKLKSRNLRPFFIHSTMSLNLKFLACLVILYNSYIKEIHLGPISISSRHDTSTRNRIAIQNLEPSPANMDLDTSPQINPQDTLYRPASPDSLSDLESQAGDEGGVLLKEVFIGTENQASNMELDDLDQGHGSVAITTEPQSISSRNRLTGIANGSTDLPSPKSKESTPTIYSRSPLTSIPEEQSGTMDLDDDIMPDLEDTASIHNPPPSPPYPPKQSTKKLVNDATFPNLKIKALPALPSQHSTMEIDDTASASSSSTEKGDPRIEIEWFVWPPEPYEKDVCERVCEEVAILHGFQRVIIKCANPLSLTFLPPLYLPTSASSLPTPLAQNHTAES
jgi:hypothetical protein